MGAVDMGFSQEGSLRQMLKAISGLMDVKISTGS